MTLKIELTEEGLFVNKYRCRSVTVEQTKEGYTATLFYIEGITKQTLLYDVRGYRIKDRFGHDVYKITKISKKIKCKEVSYEGITLSNPSKNYGYCRTAKNKKGDYVNLYPIEE